MYKRKKSLKPILETEASFLFSFFINLVAHLFFKEYAKYEILL